MTKEYGLMVGGSLDGQELDYFGDPGDMIAYEVHRGGGWEFMPYAPGMGIEAEVAEYYQWLPDQAHFEHDRRALLRTEREDQRVVWQKRHDTVYFLVTPPENVSFNPALDPIESIIHLCGVSLAVALTTQAERLSGPHHETVAEAMRTLLRVSRQLKGNP